MVNKIVFWGFILFLAFSNYKSEAQVVHDTSITKNRKNIVRINLTRSLVFGFKNYSIGYERVFKGFNSATLNVGYLSFPQLFNFGLSKYGVNRERQSFGFSAATEYRRYFKKRNRGFAPDGLYIGAYLSNFHYNSTNRITFDNSYGVASGYADVNTMINVFQAGIEVGYQFILYKRFALDLIMIGPGLGNYRLDINLDGNVSPQLEDEVHQDMLQSAIEKYPLVETLIQDRSFKTSGSFDKWSAGYRVIVHLGFLF